MSNVRPFPAAIDEDDGGYIDRPVPADLAAEQAVLSACMYDTANVERVSFLDRSDFYKGAHQLVWDVLQQQHRNGDPTGPIAIHNEITKLGQLRTVNGGDYLHTISQAPSVSAEYFAGIVQEKAVLRRKAELAVRLNVEVQRGTAPGHLDKLLQDHLEDEQQRARGGRTSTVDALLAEMLDTNALDDMPALEPLVGDLLHLDTLARVIGPSGHMKSFVTIDFAGHVGTGKPWHGNHVHQGTVVYLVAEGARGIRKRVRAWEQHHGLRMENVLFLPRPVQAMDPEWLTLIEACKRLGPVFIIVDTQARVSVGIEENSAKEMGLVIDRMEQLRAATGACVLVIHHTGHIGDHGRGSSSAKGALQSELHVSKKGDRASNTIVTIKTGKQKDDEQGADLDFGLRIVDIAGEAKPDGSPLTSVVLLPIDSSAFPPVPGTVEFVMAALDKANVPNTHGREKLRAECATRGIPARTDVLTKVAQIRKARTGQTHPNHLTQNLTQGTFQQPDPTPGSGNDKTPGQTRPNTPEVRLGQAASGPDPLNPTLRSGQVGGQPRPNTPICTLCDTPLDPDWASRGYDTHLLCQPTRDEP
ncbi:AAA family ATPase [Kitasatospora sp. McL0602]|uniref:AAA family ATPase n=1 Tax=Kitasatospora sp. McL0602 TaxID=3439530 RepID=UPI003F890816